MTAADANPVHRALGLTDDELDSIIAILGREPNYLELAMYSVMWSEHCSYKSSRSHLRRLPSEAPWVLVGPGENAGVIDAGDGLALAIRIESHNHPSAVEPYQGAATGVGGILRDIFTMGARPIALADPLRTGPLSRPRSRWHLDGIVSGVSGYGNAVGVPTVAGEVDTDECYAENPLVNVLAVGILPTDRLVLGQASGIGNVAVLLGSRTGRDGIGGVSVLASAGFGDAEAEASKRPSVQVGDPFEEKRLIEACLELLDRKVVIGIQDLGGAGITCATSETASRGGVGMDVNVWEVAQREPNMQPFEIMTSESQERMLAIVEPSNMDIINEVCQRWDVRASVIGKVTEGNSLRILDGWDGGVLAEIPARSLHEDAPQYDRPLAPPADHAAQQAQVIAVPATHKDVAEYVLDVLRNRAWVYRQYDSQLFLNTVMGPGQADAALMRLAAPGVATTTRGFAITTDGNHRWCAVDPRIGTAMVVLESTMNLACVGARARAVVDNLNFGNPEHPEVMWQLSESIDGMAEACRALNVPVVGGNVSLYNESGGKNIHPTPVVGAVGLVDELTRRPAGIAAPQDGVILHIGPVPTPLDSLAGTRWAWRAGQQHGSLPAIDYDMHQRVLDTIVELVNEPDLLLSVHDIADGGLALALAEVAVRSGRGVQLDETPLADPAVLVNELPSRAIVVVPAGREGHVALRAEAHGVEVKVIGRLGGTQVSMSPGRDDAVDLDTLATVHTLENEANS